MDAYRIYLINNTKPELYGTGLVVVEANGDLLLEIWE